MEKDTVEYIKNKSFFELSPKEKEGMKDLFTTEEEFNEIKALFIQMDGLSAESFKPSENVKESLDDVFVHQYAATQSRSFLALIVSKNKPIYRQPLVQLAAMALLLLLVVPVFNSPLVEETIQVAELKKGGGIETNNRNEVKSENVEEIKSRNELNLDVENSEIQLDQLVEKKTVKMKVLQPQILPGPVGPIPSPVLIEAPLKMGFNHPDGIYQEEKEVVAFTSVSAQESSDLLDLLTTTF